ncbi:GNAT family N-acetyltransferase [Brevibacterium album]|uniref:GNAT family N-acetyltransferase n=1 Tax=Brevibacterium album TaxID=417948 RepID=UPI0004078E76|nr:GNAT family N-acetyltransferase [Brevibacterium album]
MRAAHGEWVRASFDALTAGELYGLLQLRSRVFVVEQDCAFLDLDGVDTLAGTEHLFLPQPPRAARDSHGAAAGVSLEPAAYARILPEGFADGPAAAPGARSVGRVVTDPAARGGGLGHLLMEQVVALHGHADLTLNAQAHLAGFYGRHGFAPSGEGFDEDGIPHVPMLRPGTAAAQAVPARPAPARAEEPLSARR